MAFCQVWEFVESLEAQRLSLESSLNLFIEILAHFPFAVVCGKLGKLFNIPQPVVSPYQDW